MDGQSNIYTIVSPTNIDRSLNPITAESDWHLISPNNITPKLNLKAMRIKELITN